MRRISLLVCLLCPLSVYAQSQNLEMGDFSFSLSSKILKDGSITDIGLGYAYTEKWSGEARFRAAFSAKNGELMDTADSLNAEEETIFEVFFLPARYTAVKTQRLRLLFGGGVYYEYDTLKEKGFFNMPELEPAHERVNSYTNDFSMHVVGPLVHTGLSYNAQWVSASLSAGIVPVFYLRSSQKMGMIPLLDPNYAEYDQDTGGSPYVFLSLDAVLFKYVNLALLYDAAKLDYKDIDFDFDEDGSVRWINPERTVFNQSLKLEASLLIPLGDLRVRIGYGHTFDSRRVDSAEPVTGNRNYFILTAGKTGR